MNYYILQQLLNGSPYLTIFYTLIKILLSYTEKIPQSDGHNDYILYIEFDYNQNSMALYSQILTIVLYLITTCLCYTNLVADYNFQVYGGNVTQHQTSVPYPFYYEYYSQPVSGWWSPISASILFRTQSQPLPSNIVMDSLANNSHNKICHNFTLPTSMPYQLNYSRKIDDNIIRPRLALYWNNVQLMYMFIRSNTMQTQNYLINSSNSSGLNMLCFQAWAQQQTYTIGALIDDVILIKQDVRYVGFTTMLSRQQPNTVILVSNQTVTSQQQLSILQQLNITIANVEYQIQSIYADPISWYLCIKLKIYGQYASTVSRPVISLPVHRNTAGEVIFYANITSTLMPPIIYCPDQDQQILAQSEFYVKYVVTIYAVLWRIIRIIEFGFVGVNWVYGYQTTMLFGFLDIQYISISSRNALKSILNTGVDILGVGYIMKLAGYSPYQYGAQWVDISQQLPQPNNYSIQYNAGGLSMNLYSLIVDNLAISLFNVIKLLFLYYIVFGNRPSFIKLLKPIKNNKIIVDFIVILPPVILVIAVTWIIGVPVTNFWGAINRSCGIAVVGTAIWFTAAVYIGDFSRYSYKKRLALNKSHGVLSQNNQKLSKYYSNSIFMDLFQTIAIIITPILVGLGLIYSTLTLYFILTLFSLISTIKILKSYPNFPTFFRLLGKLLQLYLSISLFTAYAISLIQLSSIQPSAQISLMTFLRYNSLVLPFTYVAVGFVESVYIILKIGKSIMGLQRICGKAKYPDNQVTNQQQTEIKITKDQQVFNQDKKQQCASDASGIRVINQLRDRVQKSSSTIKSKPQISNPFINSIQTIQSKQIQLPSKQKQAQQHSRKASRASKCSIKQQQASNMTPPVINIKLDNKQGRKQKRMTKVITMKNIDIPASRDQLGVQQNFYQRAKSKSSTYLDQHQQTEQKQNQSIIIKKTKQVGPMALKRKTIKLIQKLAVPKPNQNGEFQLKSQQQNQFKDKEAADHFKIIKASNFQKQQNFS